MAGKCVHGMYDADLCAMCHKQPIAKKAKRKIKPKSYSPLHGCAASQIPDHPSKVFTKLQALHFAAAVEPKMRSIKVAMRCIVCRRFSWRMLAIDCRHVDIQEAEGWGRIYPYLCPEEDCQAKWYKEHGKRYREHTKSLAFAYQEPWSPPTGSTGDGSATHPFSLSGDGGSPKEKAADELLKPVLDRQKALKGQVWEMVRAAVDKQEREMRESEAARLRSALVTFLASEEIVRVLDEAERAVLSGQVMGESVRDLGAKLGMSKSSAARTLDGARAKFRAYMTRRNSKTPVGIDDDDWDILQTRLDATGDLWQEAVDRDTRRESWNGSLESDENDSQD